MKTLKLAVAFSLFGLLAFSTTDLQAQGHQHGRLKTRAPIYTGKYSYRLQGTFTHRHNFFIPGYAPFPGARVVNLDPTSPLWQIGVRPGDVISRLDGIRIHDLGELDRHYANTRVRWIPTGTNTVRSAWVNLGPLHPGNGQVVYPGGVSP